MKITYRTAILLLVLSLSSCAPSSATVMEMSLPELRGNATDFRMNNSRFRQAVRDRFNALHPEWNAIAKAAIADGKVNPGMTMDQVTASWGRPVEDGDKIVSAGGTSSAWEYGRYPHGRTVYFFNGIVESVSFDSSAPSGPGR